MQKNEQFSQSNINGIIYASINLKGMNIHATQNYYMCCLCLPNCIYDFCNAVIMTFLVKILSNMYVV